MLSFTYKVAGKKLGISVRRNKIMVWNSFMMLKKRKVDIYPFADKLLLYVHSLPKIIVNISRHLIAYEQRIRVTEDESMKLIKASQITLLKLPFIE